jgi:hypothetical protein
MLAGKGLIIRRRHRLIVFFARATRRFGKMPRDAARAGAACRVGLGDRAGPASGARSELAMFSIVISIEWL